MGPVNRCWLSIYLEEVFRRQGDVGDGVIFLLIEVLAGERSNRESAERSSGAKSRDISALMIGLDELARETYAALERHYDAF